MNSGQTTTTPTQPAASSINGNWDFLATSSSFPGVTLQMGGILTTTGNNVTGTLFAGHSNNSSCFTLLEPVPVTGTINKSGQLTMTSAAVNNQIITVVGSLAPGGASYSGVTYSVASGTGSQAGCAAGDQGIVTASPAYPLSAAYAGNITSQSTGDVFSATADLSEQTDSFNGAPYLTLSGTLLVNGSACFSKATLSPGLAAGTTLINVVFGNELLFFVTPSSSTTLSQDLGIYGEITQGGSVIDAGYAFGGGLCGDDAGSGTLNAQP